MTASIEVNIPPEPSIHILYQNSVLSRFAVEREFPFPQNFCLPINHGLNRLIQIILGYIMLCGCQKWSSLSAKFVAELELSGEIKIYSS